MAFHGRRRSLNPHGRTNPAENYLWRDIKRAMDRHKFLIGKDDNRLTFKEESFLSNMYGRGAGSIPNQKQSYYLQSITRKLFK